MNDSVTQAQRLIGARLRDPRRRRQGCIIGIDQNGGQPALLIVWEGQGRAERVPLPPHELRTLVQACDTVPPSRRVWGNGHQALVSTAGLPRLPAPAVENIKDEPITAIEAPRFALAQGTS
ncbi:hypothetical protein MHM84_12210 [Halomonas sp. McH1-25]|uniref:hypothetical protein n=1 Tax=unclassified Halomonas TaxID=2609666 RepID=UPI001EF56AD2|nr:MULTISPECIES: hypothetical protein [unclassified Halomonas]MCG7600556.1 hypothetical protein [Halomonas sp. McH1-25]MCP1342023.1 hypothetical protein [Halomonas sp. FL8]MCP1361991.1 hypothetical protein [Halomonas sp. BBD45]MCP1365862.1 hypothetical protein [Halomonas sp. BBD48]